MQVVNVVSNFGLAWQQSFGIIVVLYFYSHYLFASGAAHIGAMYTAFLSVAIACGTPGLLAAIALGQVLHLPTSPHPSRWLDCSCLCLCMHTGLLGPLLRGMLQRQRLSMQPHLVLAQAQSAMSF